MSAKKIIIIASVVLVLAGVVIGSILHSQANVTKVSTGKAVHQELVSIVSGTGQIKPKTYVNIGATAMGRVTRLFVKEGDEVKMGQTVATIENVQQQATVSGQEATIATTTGRKVSLAASSSA